MERFTKHEHQLWISISSKSEGNFLSRLSKIFQDFLFEQEIAAYKMDLEEFLKLTLPSDPDFRFKIYQKLVQKKRMSMLIEENEVVKLHDWDIKPKATPKFSSPIIERLKKEVSLIYGPSEITWTLTDIAKASYLLSNPPRQVQFDDEQEMRRVYTLIYDVFRHKNVLIAALDSCSFFEEYSVLKDVRPKVWMLLFDLYHRNFKHRDLRQREAAKNIFSEYGIWEIEESLWAQRIHLAASVARMRIKNNALRLSDLLPKHLRDDRIQYSQLTPVTCWVNVNKIKNVDEITNQLKSTLNVKPLEDEKFDLEPDKFKWDKVCPHFIILHSSVRTKLSQSPLVQKHKLILQDRSFCLGPAAFGKVVTELQLKGTVIQSHIHSPRATAYLANLLSQNGKISKLVVFSAGNRKPEYEDYLNKLGTKNVSVFSEKLFECGSEESCLEEATAIFATPPNSYSAVSDPIDLVCSRGGDLNLLEILTETEITQEGKKRIKGILDEQKKTLQFAMTKPQIQVVMYETHSEIDAENNQMVDKTLEYINKITQLKHAVIQGKLSTSDLPRDAFTFKKKEITTDEISKYVDHDKLVRKYFELESVSSISLLSDESQQSLNSIITEGTLNDVEVPPCDLFEKPKLKEVSPKLSSFGNLKKQGCYLALIQRKKITHLDNKYMIEVAESRGLFGKDSEAPDKQKKIENPKKKRKTSPRPSKTFKRNQPIEISKIAAPTLAFKRHSADSTNVPCPREEQRMLSYSKDVVSSGGVSNKSLQYLQDFDEIINITSRRHEKIKKRLQELKMTLTIKKKAPRLSLDQMNVIKSKYNSLSRKSMLRKIERNKRKSKKLEDIEDEEKEVTDVLKPLTDQEIEKLKQQYRNPFELMRTMTADQMKNLIHTPLVGSPIFNELAKPVNLENRRRKAIENIEKREERIKRIVAGKLSGYSKPKKKVVVKAF